MRGHHADRENLSLSLSLSLSRGNAPCPCFEWSCADNWRRNSGGVTDRLLVRRRVNMGCEERPSGRSDGMVVAAARLFRELDVAYQRAVVCIGRLDAYTDTDTQTHTDTQTRTQRLSFRFDSIAFPTNFKNWDDSLQPTPTFRPHLTDIRSPASWCHSS